MPRPAAKSSSSFFFFSCYVAIVPRQRTPARSATIGKRTTYMDATAIKCIKCQAKAKLRCAICRIWYCSKECQRADWPVHKSKCRPLPMREQFLASQDPNVDLDRKYKLPVFNKKSYLFVPRPSGELPTNMMPLDDAKVRQELGFPETSGEHLKFLEQQCVVRVKDYVAVMRQLTPRQVMEMAIRTKMHVSASRQEAPLTSTRAA